MHPIDNIVEQLDLNRLVPDGYREYRPLMKDAVRFFLSRLPRADRDAVIAAQAALPEGTPGELRAFSILSKCPTLHKVGQVLARHEGLDDSVRDMLTRLEFGRPTIAPGPLDERVRDLLGDDFERYQIDLDFSVLAEGSVATVVGCTWSRPNRKRRHRAALKVLKPGVEEKVRTELHILSDLSDFLDRRRERYDVPVFEYRETLETVRDLLLRETHLASEQIHLRNAGIFYKSQEAVCVPARLPFSNHRITAMEYVDGAKITIDDDDADSARARAADVLDSLISRVVFSRRDETMFHADPHAGNLFATKDGRVAILDWALVGRLTKRQRELLAHMMWAGLTLDKRKIRRAMNALALDVRDKKAARNAIDEALQKVRAGRLPGPTWVGELFDGLLGAGVHFPADLLLFRKSLFTIKGVINDIDPEFSIDKEFLLTFAKFMVREFPKRFARLPFSREYRSQLSNIDLIRTYLNSPLIVARYVGVASA